MDVHCPQLGTQGTLCVLIQTTSQLQFFIYFIVNFMAYLFYLLGYTVSQISLFSPHITYYMCVTHCLNRFGPTILKDHLIFLVIFKRVESPEANIIGSLLAWNEPLTSADFHHIALT